MIEERVIKSNGCKYIGDIMKDLPDNVMLNKVTTGCGMTSVVLENDLKYVLAVPYTSLIKNKMKWCKDRGIPVCSVYYGGADEAQIRMFSGNKIIVTYDSLEKVTNVLTARGDIKQWKLCVDEAHKLVDSAAFRPNAISSVLNNYKKYKAFVFGTATPVKDKYQLPELKGIAKVKISWGNLKKVNVNYCQYEGRINEVAAILALDFINNERDGNAHIFINSVQSICSIIRYMTKGGFSSHDEIRIVCADNPRNQNLIETKISKEYYVSLVGSAVKKVNFYTSTAFEGCDIFDEEGKNYIITDGTKDSTKIDIVTVLPQIIGRVRNSKYKDTIDLLYTPNKYFSNKTEEQFEEEVRNNISKAEKDILEFNGLRPDSSIRLNMLENNDNAYLIVEGDVLKLNDNAWYNEMHNYSTMNSTYFVSKDGTKSTITDGTKRFNDVGYEYKGISKVKVAGLNKVKLGKAPSFKDLCIDYSEILNSETGLLRSAKIAKIKKIEPLIVKGFSKLGSQRMKALEYRKKDVVKALLVVSNEDTCFSKIVKLLNLRNGVWYSRKEIKSKLTDVYLQLGLNKTAKALELKKWYDLELKNQRVDGKVVSGFMIIGCRISF